MDSFMKPYADAGHDVESLFLPGSAYKCAWCREYQIDLSEDLSYGAMRRCTQRHKLPLTPTSDKA